MDIDIKELIKTATENLNLKDFKGDVVAVKVVENEFGTIEEGSIGVHNVYYGADGSKKNKDTEEILPNEDGTTSEDSITIVEMPQSVKDVFVQPACIEKYVRAMMKNYYGGSPLSLALIYCVLNDYSLIRSLGNFQKFVTALIEWQMLSPTDEKQVKTLADSVSAYMRDRYDHGKIRPGLTSDFRNWTDTKKKQECEAIASVFGEADNLFNPQGTIHYKYKK